MYCPYWVIFKDSPTSRSCASSMEPFLQAMLAPDKRCRIPVWPGWWIRIPMRSACLSGVPVSSHAIPLPISSTFSEPLRRYSLFTAVISISLASRRLYVLGNLNDIVIVEIQSRYREIGFRAASVSPRWKPRSFPNRIPPRRTPSDPLPDIRTPSLPFRGKWLS